MYKPHNKNLFVLLYISDINCTALYSCYVRIKSRIGFILLWCLAVSYVFVVICTYVYYLQTNTLQCVLATTLTESFIIFLYADGRMQWTTGDDSGGSSGLGGTEALAGINAGDGVNSITIPGSITPEVINITQTSNVGTPGVWMFKVGEGNCIIMCAHTHTKHRPT